jgi:hypothetical protein
MVKSLLQYQNLEQINEQPTKNTRCQLTDFLLGIILLPYTSNLFFNLENDYLDQLK